MQQRATPQEFTAAATKAQAFNDETQAALNRLHNDAQALRSNWRSREPGRMFDVNIDTWMDDMRVMKAEMDEIIRMLRASGTGFQTLVDDQQRRLGNIYSDLNTRR
ncbi:MAG TPA: WXG100 family type VII secretion target [Micromonosporaceae bacterium]|nr:WXG100 family type VII secretion target [Micromonosporaceae bacterium]